MNNPRNKAVKGKKKFYRVHGTLPTEKAVSATISRSSFRDEFLNDILQILDIQGKRWQEEYVMPNDLDLIVVYVLTYTTKNYDRSFKFYEIITITQQRYILSKSTFIWKILVPQINLVEKLWMASLSLTFQLSKIILRGKFLKKLWCCVGGEV